MTLSVSTDDAGELTEDCGEEIATEALLVLQEDAVWRDQKNRKAILEDSP